MKMDGNVMTIKELIELLKQYPQDKTVLINGYKIDDPSIRIYEISEDCVTIDDPIN